MTTPLTPAEHRARAETDLARLAAISPGTEAYRSLSLSALAHYAAVIDASLALLAEWLKPPPDQGIPGLPPGWRLDTQQSGTGNRLWGYILASPGRDPSFSRYQWGSSETALTAGLRAAGELAGNGSKTGQESNHER